MFFFGFEIKGYSKALPQNIMLVPVRSLWPKVCPSRAILGHRLSQTDNKRKTITITSLKSHARQPRQQCKNPRCNKQWITNQWQQIHIAWSIFTARMTIRCCTIADDTIFLFVAMLLPPRSSATRSKRTVRPLPCRPDKLQLIKATHQGIQPKRGYWLPQDNASTSKQCD